MLIRLCLSLLQSYYTKDPKTKFLTLEYFRMAWYNPLIINTMKNLFLRIFHLSDYQAVTSTIKHLYVNPRKTLIFCSLQALTKDCGHAYRKYLLISQNTHIYSGVLKKHPHGNTRCHPKRSEGSPHRQHKDNATNLVIARRVYPTWQSPTHIPYHFTRTHGTHQAPLTSINNNTRTVSSIHDVCGYAKRYLRVGVLVTTFCVYGYSKRYLTVLRDIMLSESEVSPRSRQATMLIECCH